ncbi:MAG: hypothetical protein ACXAEU_19730 [Candidatus Hodarchaeales archaeon]
MEIRKISWSDLDYEQRRIEVLNRRKNKESWADIAEALTGSRAKKSIIFQWAKRNISTFDLKKAEGEIVLHPDFSDGDRWEMYDLINKLFPQLNAVVEHLLHEIKNLQEEQQKKFYLTAGFLDTIEERLTKSIKASMPKVIVQQSSSYPARGATGTGGPPPPPGATRGTGPPPPPSGTGSLGPPPPGTTPQSSVAQSGTLKTDFEEMTMDEIKALPPDFLEVLTPTDKGRIQARVKELKTLAKMTPEQLEEYLEKKRKEKELEEASTGLGDSLKSMLGDQDSLFAKMKRAAEGSAISGSGTFGQFATDFIYSYCYSCCKSIRNEDEAAVECSYCGAGKELVVEEEERMNYSFYECLDCKLKEKVDPTFSRGSPIIITSRWKITGNKKPKSHSCGSSNIRDITAAVRTMEDPDKQFAYYLAILRKNLQLKMSGKLQEFIEPIQVILQSAPDLLKYKEALTTLEETMKMLMFFCQWLKSCDDCGNIDTNVLSDAEHLLVNLNELQEEESPQHYKKMNETNQVTAKIDQLIGLFIPIVETIKVNFKE